MNTIWKAQLLVLVLLAPAALWPQADTKAKSDGSEAAQSASTSPNASGSTAPAAGESPAAPLPGATPTASPTPMPGDSTKLEVLKSVRADYPYEARENQIQGQVVLRLAVSEKGEVQKVEVVRGDPVLADAAVKAAKQWKFKPFIKNGKATAVATQIPFDFAFSELVEDKKDSAQDAKNGGNDPAQNTRVRIPNGVALGSLVHKVAPVYPEEAKRNRIEGTVLLSAFIDTEGRVVRLKPISGPKELIPAAMDAVQQWRYRPYLLNGEPMKVETTVTVNFHLNAF